MKVIWLGHACFLIESNGSSVVIDPYDHKMMPGLPEFHAEADCVLVTHEHHDHNFREAVTLSGKECTLQIEKIEAFHDDEEGRKLGSNTIYIIDDGEFRVAHFGDLGHKLNEEQLQKLGTLDGAIVNVGGFLASEAEFATELMKDVKPSWIFPCHFRSDTYGVASAGTREEFLILQKNGWPVDGNSFDMKKSEDTHTIVFTSFE